MLRRKQDEGEEGSTTLLEARGELQKKEKKKKKGLKSLLSTEGFRSRFKVELPSTGAVAKAASARSIAKSSCSLA